MPNIIEIASDPNHDPIRVLRMPLINRVNRLASVGSCFARKMTLPNFHFLK
jgi:hypothetical protein